MELVGKVVTKELRGLGFSHGVIESYDKSTGFYKITYEDGGSEQVGLPEAISLFRSVSLAAPLSDKDEDMGRKPKKRRRFCGDPGFVLDGWVSSDPQNSGDFVSSVGSGQKSTHCDLDGNVKWNGGLDLNSVEGLSFGEGSSPHAPLDLNLTVDEEFEDKIVPGDRGCSGGGFKKAERGFDLNLGFDDDQVIAMEAELEAPLLNPPAQHNDQKQSTSSNSAGGFDSEKPTISSAEGIDLEKAYFDADQHSCVGKEEVVHGDPLKRESPSGTASDVVADEKATVNYKAFNLELNEDDLDVEAATPVACEVSNSGRRKRRKVTSDPHSPPLVPLRRSARRARAVASVDYNEASMTIMYGANASSSGMSVLSEEKPNLPENECVEESDVLPLKLELPLPSTNLNLEGIPVLDLFSVYSCLRSFSTFLYLSPFGLEDFVAALKSKVATSLLDYIHVAILQILRKHLELLSVEGSESASSCLRSLNWDFLDTVNWPIFMAEYLLFNGSQLKPDVFIEHLKLFDGDYYRQPEQMKIAILQLLCDDIIEVEAVRTELCRRTTASDFGRDFDRNMHHIGLRKTRPPMDAPQSSFLNEDVADDSTDWNSDECSLCRMEGNLICCDGCPAAYHSRCVGVSSNLLPEGEWFCPECVNRWQNYAVRPHKLIRGAELLGVDPHGRMFMSCCGYLLVSRSGDGEPSFDYYYKDDLNALLEVLQSSTVIYGPIAGEIARLFTAHSKPDLARCCHDSLHSSLHAVEGVCRPLQSLVPYKMGSIDDGLATSTKSEEMVNPVTSSEGSTEVLQASGPVQTSGTGLCQTSPISDHIDSCGVDLGSNRTGVGARGRRRGRPRKYSEAKDEKSSSVQPNSIYVNRYGFARIASTVAEELALRSSDKKNQEIIESEEEIMLLQTKAILKNSAKFCWPSVHNMCGDIQREKCGWCYCCKYPEERDCLFAVNAPCAIPEGLSDVLSVIQSKQNKFGHLVDIICQILSMEGRLRGLLLGPYLGQDDYMVFHKSALKESGFALIKQRLLLLESNLHPRALSAEWGRHVDSSISVGSASHIVVNSRKRSRSFDSGPSYVTGGGLVMLWWRGGRLSRKLFNWKGVPHSLAKKAARKGGYAKIPGLIYLDGSEYVKRSHQIAWCAAVEASTSVEQLALLVRELDSNIRWDDIENTRPLTTLDKETQKSIKLFKKAIVRRKSKEQTAVKYLLDFGKRRLIPDVVLRHGSMLEDPASERKKYWLEESYVPLHLIKVFEERRIARKAGMMVTTRKVLHGSRVLKKPCKRNCFEYLVARAERSNNYQCNHCKKVVPISEAVSCQFCKGFFHKRHVRSSSTVVASNCIYTCHKCHSGKSVNVTIKKGKLRLRKRQFKNGIKSENGIGKMKPKRGRKPKAVLVQLPVEKKRGRGRPPKSMKNANTSAALQAKKNMNVSSVMLSKRRITVDEGLPLRRSERQAKKAPDIGGGGIKEKLVRKSIAVPSREPAEVSPYLRKKRTPPLSSLWKNGLWLTRKPNDKRVTQFKRRKLFIPSGFMGRIDECSKCTLCGEEGYTYGLNYISCESCGGWFHGDAVGVDSEIVRALIGFRCHVCLHRDPPFCPYAKSAKGDDAAVMAENHCGIDMDLMEGHVIQSCGPEVDAASSVQEQMIEARDESVGDKLSTMEVLDWKIDEGFSLSEAGRTEDTVKANVESQPDVLNMYEERNVLEEGSQDPINAALLPNGSKMSVVKVGTEDFSQDVAMESASQASEGEASTLEMATLEMAGLTRETQIPETGPTK